MALDLIIIGIVVLAAIIVILIFNSLISSKNRVENAWSQIDVQLKRRYELIPNLVETVKGYAKYEQATFQKITEARTRMMNAKSVKDTAQADNMLSGALKSLFAVAEAYPDLKANQNFLNLQDELSGTENKIAYSRQFYNEAVLMYNNAIQQFPGSMVAGMMAFKQKEYYEVEPGSRQPVKVSF